MHPSSEVDPTARIGAGTRVWHFCNVQANAVIGERCSLGQNVNVGPGVRIGNGVKIQNNVSVFAGVELEDDVFCGPSMVFTNVVAPRSRYPAGGRYVPTRVREGATLGANCTVVCGHTIGRHAFVAAGAVVSGDVPDYAKMVGVPARRVGWVCECGESLADPEGETITCGRCERRYTLREDRLAPATD